MPKAFNKMSLSEQEEYLVNKLQKARKEINNIQKQLASVRGGKKIEIDERPDELSLKT
jgi:hypothetical protein